MTAPHAADEDALDYRNPHEQPKKLGGWTIPELMELQVGWFKGLADPYLNGRFASLRMPAGLRWAPARRGWHGPLPADLHAAHVAREQQAAATRRAAEVAQLALEARRSANPMWQKVHDAIDQHGGYESDPENAADAVMDTFYGEGQW